MRFKELEWKDIISDGVIISSTCDVKVYGCVIRMEFRISYKKDEDRYYLCSFGQGSIRRLKADVFDSLEGAKSAAYRIYSYEMERIKKAVDCLVVMDND